MTRLLTATDATTVSTASVEIPDDLRAELVELYKFLKENPNKRGSGTFADRNELDLFVKQAKSWAAINDVEFRMVRGSLSEDGTSFAFYLRDRVSDEDKAEAAAKREAAKAKREAEGKGTPGRKPSAKPAG